MKARIVNDTIVEIIKPIPGFNIQDCFHPSILESSIDIPEGADIGWFKNEAGEWVAPTPPPRLWSISDVRNGLTLAEKVKWDSDQAPEIVTAKLELASPLPLEKITPVLQMLVTATVITKTSMTAILK